MTICIFSRYGGLVMTAGGAPAKNVWPIVKPVGTGAAPGGSLGGRSK